jgi:hypothetical protein
MQAYARHGTIGERSGSHGDAVPVSEVPRDV